VVGCSLRRRGIPTTMRPRPRSSTLERKGRIACLGAAEPPSTSVDRGARFCLHNPGGSARAAQQSRSIRAFPDLAVEGEQGVPGGIAGDIPGQTQEAVMNRLAGRSEAHYPDFRMKSPALLADRDDGILQMSIEKVPLRRHVNAARLAEDREAVRVGAKRVQGFRGRGSGESRRGGRDSRYRPAASGNAQAPDKSKE
jgi:hypothetical protein